MARSPHAPSQIIVADARPHDYQELTRWALEHDWRVHLLTSARAVLRLTSAMSADLYLVNTRLPDMSGFDLFEMLRDRVPAARIFIISDSYADAEERRACCSGAAWYVCKMPDGAVDWGTLLNSIVGQSGSMDRIEPDTTAVPAMDSFSQPFRVRFPADVPLEEQSHSFHFRGDVL